MPSTNSTKSNKKLPSYCYSYQPLLLQCFSIFKLGKGRRHLHSRNWKSKCNRLNSGEIFLSVQINIKWKTQENKELHINKHKNKYHQTCLYPLLILELQHLISMAWHNLQYMSLSSTSAPTSYTLPQVTSNSKNLSWTKGSHPLPLIQNKD